MSNDNEHAEVARRLGRWLDQPGTAPPSELDDDVVQAVFAMRPDLAPAPDVSLDEILNGVQAGPFAPAEPVVAGSQSGSAPGADIVPFPSPEDPSHEEAEANSSGRRTAAMWAGGAGGLGLALVVAATLLLVALPNRPDPSSELAAAPAASGEAADAATEAPLDLPNTPQLAAKKEELRDQVAEAPKSTNSRPESSADGALRARPAPSPLEAAASQAGQGQEQLLRKRQAVALPGGPARPESEWQPAEEDADVAKTLDEPGYQQDREDYAIADRASIPEQGTIAEMNGTAPGRAVPDEPESDDATASRSVPPTYEPPPPWRNGVEAAVLARVDRAIAKATRFQRNGKLEKAASALASAVVAPAPVAHHLALQSARLYLQAGDLSSAVAVLSKANQIGPAAPYQQAEREALLRQVREGPGAAH